MSKLSAILDEHLNLQYKYYKHFGLGKGGSEICNYQVKFIKMGNLRIK